MKNKVPAKRVDIVSVYMVRENSFLYESRYINSASEVTKW